MKLLLMFIVLIVSAAGLGYFGLKYKAESDIREVFENRNKKMYPGIECYTEIKNTIGNYYVVRVTAPNSAPELLRYYSVFWRLEKYTLDTIPQFEGSGAIFYDHVLIDMMNSGEYLHECFKTFPEGVIEPKTQN